MVKLALAVAAAASIGWFAAEGRWLVALALSGAAVAVYSAFRLPAKKYVLFAIVTLALSTVATVAAVVGLDYYLHRRYENRGGYNVWGYRGASVGQKRPGEWRAVLLGGSTAFGYGVDVDKTIPAYLNSHLSARLSDRPVTVVNLGWNGQGAHSFAQTLQAYEYLDYDVAILYGGYNDLGPNTLNFRNDSAVFRLTGYLPILPVIPVRDWLHIRDLSETSAGDQRVRFQPNLLDRYATEAADTALRISQALEAQLGRLSPAVDPGPTQPDNCAPQWSRYCDSMMAAVEEVVRQGKTVIVVTEPYISDTHILQQSELTGELMLRYRQSDRVKYLNLGRALSLKDPNLCYDGMHLTPPGNERIADHLARLMVTLAK